jgi:hypothetical protein
MKTSEIIADEIRNAECPMTDRLAMALVYVELLEHIANTYAVHLPDCEWFDSNDTPCSCGYESAMGEIEKERGK